MVFYWLLKLLPLQMVYYWLVRQLPFQIVYYLLVSETVTIDDCVLFVSDTHHISIWCCDFNGLYRIPAVCECVYVLCVHV
jgi:hypothetical protein